MTRPDSHDQHGDAQPPADRVHILTDGDGRYFVPVFSVAPNGEAIYVGTVVYREVTDVSPLGVPLPRQSA
ncbi:hypothetical protein [Amycolatopsis sp. cmx-11-32]|uniref:hypothetical protein n=1 Tax=Amycolatopsis sp. cmx-11-32 TaxID=2785796 RepID=UPI0039E5B155